MQKDQVYVSITGLQLKSRWHILTFWWHAIRSMIQAKSAPGNISAEGRKINGIHHTLSVWTDEKAMRTFLTTGNHLKAMKAFNRFASGKTFGFNTERVPHWSEVHQLWIEQAIEYNKMQ